jgi:acyl-phosphate glycerol 3-phosphate acyltransferase
MSATLAAVIPLAVAYLVGAIPFGYVVGQLRGVNLFEAGSGNIGATNAARVLGRSWGVLVFALDFLKGALPVAVAVPLANALANGADTALGSREVLRVGAAALAFLGHLFPIYLGFRGGKGVATGAGTVMVLVPLPATLAILAWVLVLFASRMVSLASLTAAIVLVVSHFAITPNAVSAVAVPVMFYLVIGSAFVFLKHRANVKRLLAGTENQVREFGMRQPVLRSLHVVALGLWFGGAAFFNFGTATAIFASFKDVVNAGPSDRTAYETILPADASQERKDALASALAGSAVGPVFPRYFAMQTVCAVIALITSLSWYKCGRLHRRRVWVIAFAFAIVLVSWPISDEVTRLRLLRFSPDTAIAAAAKAAFASWHLVSLALSFVTVCVAGIALAMAGRLPPEDAATA